MRIAKKLMAFMLAVLMIFGVGVQGLALTFTDVSDATKYSEAIESMVALGLIKGYPDGSFKPEETITRAEFAAVITRAIGMEAMVDGANSGAIFTDMVTNGTDHWATGYVKIAYDLGIIAGMGDGTFMPDSAVTYEQTVKMIVCALGYEQAAIDRGGWPDGYLAQANDLEILRGATMTPQNGPAPRGLVAQLVYNSLNIKLMEKKGDGSTTMTNKTLLKDKLKVTEFANMMVTAVDGALTITSSNDYIRSGQLLLEGGASGSKAKCVYTDVMTSEEARSLLGRYISGYYKASEEDDTLMVLIMADISTENTEISVMSDDIERMQNMSLYYWMDKENDTRTEELKIAPNAKLLYNGVTYDYLSSSDPTKANLTYWLDPNSSNFINGEVRLLDSGNDGKYDALFIDDYETYVVKSPVRTTDSNYMNNYVVYDYYTSGKSIRLDPYERGTNISIYNAKTNQEMKVEDLKAMNILSVAESSDQRTYKCYVSTDSMRGEIASTSTDGKKFTINKQSYELTKEFAAVVAAGKVSMEIGSSGTFYLDRTGRIAAANVTEVQSGNYAYITAAGTWDMMNDVAAVEIISLTGSPSTPTRYKIAKTVRINNHTYTDANAVLNALRNSASLLASNGGTASNAQYSQLVKVVINSSNEISSILTAATNNGALSIGMNTNSGVLKLGQPNDDFTYSSGSGFESQVFINSDTKVLVVPTARRDSTKYKRSTGTSYFASGSSYTIEAYDMNAASTASVIVVFGDSADVAITSETPACLIKNVSEVISSTLGTRVYRIEVYENGVEKVYESESNGSEYALSVGDVARFGFDSSGNINAVDVQATAASLTAGEDYGNNVRDENGEYKFKAIVGTVSTVTSERLIVAPHFVDLTGSAPTLDQTDRIGYGITSAVSVYKVNISSASAEVRTANISDLIEFGEDNGNVNASKIYAYSLLGDLKMVVIYE